MGFLKLKGESTMKLRSDSFGTQQGSSSSSEEEEEVVSHFLCSTFSAELEFCESPVEWLVVFDSECFTSSLDTVTVEVLCEEGSSPMAPTRSFIS